MESIVHPCPELATTVGAIEPTEHKDVSPWSTSSSPSSRASGGDGNSDSPNLRDITSAWPHLSVRVRQAILTLIELDISHGLGNNGSDLREEFLKCNDCEKAKLKYR